MRTSVTLCCSTGPDEAAAGRAKSAQNGRKHGLRSEREKLAREESIAYESRYLRWAASFGVESDPEEFLLNANVFLSSEMDRVKFAYLEHTQGEIDNAENEEIKAARETGARLFSDPRAGLPVSMFGTRRFNVKKPGGPSWGTGAAPAVEPEELLEELGIEPRWGATGCWARSGRTAGAGAQAFLGRRGSTADGQTAWAESCGRRHRPAGRKRFSRQAMCLRPVGKPFDALLSEMSEPAQEDYVKEIVAMWPDLSHKSERDKARQSLIDLVEGEIERVQAIAAVFEENAGEDAVRMRALKGFVYTPKAEAMRRWFVRAKNSVERGGKVLRQEIRARKADREGQGLPPVPGKDISPYQYDGRPASWWGEKVEAGRRAEGGGRRKDWSGTGRRAEGGGRRREEAGRRAEDGGRRAEDGGWGREDFARDGNAVDGDCGGGGADAGGGSGAAVEIGREALADGTRSVPATSNGKGRGWDSVVVEEADVLACGGYLPEKYVGGAGESEGDREAEPATAVEDEAPTLAEAARSDPEKAGHGETELNAGGIGEATPEERADGVDRGPEEPVVAGGGLTLVVREHTPTGAGGSDCANAPNEANCCDDMHIAQHQDSIEVPANSGDVSGPDGCQANPIFVGTEPGSASGAEAGGSGGSTTSEARALTERERRDAWIEIRRREWIRQRAEKEARAREERAAWDARAMNAGGNSAGAGEAVPSQDVRGP